jgi:aminopeptidase N
MDVLDYDLSISLPDTGAAISARAVLSVRRAAGTSTLVLDLLDLRVRKAMVNGMNAPFSRTDSTVVIELPRTEGDSLLVTVEYGGVVKDGLIIRTDSLGRWTGFADNWPNRARHWIPSIDHPSDKATVTWRVTAPAARTVVANGALIERTPLPSRRGGARTLSVWRESRPIAPYLMVIAAAPLAMVDLGRTACGLAEQPGCVPQSVYASPELRDYLPGPFADAGAMVAYFSELAGPYPYEKLAHLQSATRFGGMENATAIFYSDAAFRRRSVSTNVIAHETAHQWFGDAVTEREWSHLWLSEGFATYFAELWAQHSQGDSVFEARMRAIRDQILSDSVVAMRPVIDTTETNYMRLLNTNSYQKGAYTLHMLRSIVGDSAFFSGIRRYVSQHRHSTALTADLKDAMEHASGEELDWFFDEWLRRPGYAEVATSWRYDRASHRVILEVKQSGRRPPYRFPLTVAIRDGAGGVQHVTVQVDAAQSQRFTLGPVLDEPPADLVMDPDAQLLASFNSP